MEGTGAPGWSLRELLLMLLLCVSGLHVEGQEEELMCLEEGEDKILEYHYNRIYMYSPKAWQRVESQGLPKTLVKTETKNDDLNRAQVGRFLLEDNPTTGFVTITMRRLQRQDVGLYQCVILLDPLVILPYPTRLVLCPDSSSTHASDINSTPNLAKKSAFTSMKGLTPTLADISTFPTTETLSTVYTSRRTVTQPFSKSTAVVSSPDPGVNFTNVTGVISVSFFSIVIPVVCGIFGKSLVFAILFAVTQRSFGP
ncbi:PREDICTED: triggering receptor expressed on myeloid cells 1 isoform X1 [Chinchilla lanigera]|uniref:Triggering receptor expressed on myeloid cells 1 n=1 Tax=Chinchilla lanigera TaxID=34839 RepID=A0A8C2VYQ4_CHILA|nr:PREDICTED: triggering receptor expressed on myeloid cells 1 isoform X1 [Chinchilla lanigera]